MKSPFIFHWSFHKLTDCSVLVVQSRRTRWTGAPVEQYRYFWLVLSVFCLASLFDKTILLPVFHYRERSVVWRFGMVYLPPPSIKLQTELPFAIMLNCESVSGKGEEGVRGSKSGFGFRTGLRSWPSGETNNKWRINIHLIIKYHWTVNVVYGGLYWFGNM